MLQVQPPAWRLVPFYFILSCFDARHWTGFIKLSLCHVKMASIGLGWYQLANPQCVCIKSDNCFSQTIYSNGIKTCPNLITWLVCCCFGSLALLDTRMWICGICCKGNKLINTGLQEEFQNYSGEFLQLRCWRWKTLYLVRKKQRICLCTSL